MKIEAASDTGNPFISAREGSFGGGSITKCHICGIALGSCFFPVTPLFPYF
jgi:hypothetical protein|tara:strand:+ start:3062 stop:3214 length:153 start_codon:yes stop_codon:yes gene_type:complete